MVIYALVKLFFCLDKVLANWAGIEAKLVHVEDILQTTLSHLFDPLRVTSTEVEIT